MYGMYVQQQEAIGKRTVKTVRDLVKSCNAASVIPITQLGFYHLSTEVDKKKMQRRGETLVNVAYRHTQEAKRGI